MINLILLTALCFAQDLDAVPTVFSTVANSFFQDFDVRDTNFDNYRPLLANVVRLAFHSCAGSTGCCGYVNLDESDNAGLALGVDYLEEIMPEFTSAGFSRADLYAFASQLAVGMALGDSFDQILSTIELGREDCAEMPIVGDVDFPSAHESPFEYMNTHFGFSARDTVAIMGAHNIGRAQIGNSGFNGFWVPNPLTLDNEFFDRISDNPWEQEVEIVGGDERHSWEQNDLLALNSDMFLVRNFETLDSGRVVNNGCRNNFNNCMDADTLDDVEFFRDNENAFQDEFRQVYARMLRSAGDGLEQDLTPLCELYDCTSVQIETPVIDDNQDNSSDSSDSSDDNQVVEDNSQDDDNNSDSSEQNNASDSSDSSDEGQGRGRGRGRGRGGRGGRGRGRGRGRRLL